MPQTYAERKRMYSRLTPDRALLTYLPIAALGLPGTAQWYFSFVLPAVNAPAGLRPLPLGAGGSISTSSWGI